MKMSVAFHHGLGDASNFAHMLPLFLRREYDVEIECSPDKAVLFRAAGARIVPHAAREHPWLHPLVDHCERLDQQWSGNKVGFNLDQQPMPDIGRAHERWNELCSVRLSLKELSTPRARDAALELINDLPRPIILLHTQGNCSPESKNYAPAHALYYQLLDRTKGSLILLDWDNRVPKMHTYRVRHLTDDYRPLNLLELYELMEMSDLFIGIDSGLLHFTRFTGINAIGVWPQHYPAHFLLPRENTLNLVPGKHQAGDKYRRLAFNTVCFLSSTDALAPEDVAGAAVRMLSKPKYFGPSQLARDVQLQYLIDLARGPSDGPARNPQGTCTDRHKSFAKVLKRLASYYKPLIVETGCIRSEEDWAGAGFSTYLFGHFLKQHAKSGPAHGGHLHSVDLTEQHCAFARAWTAEARDYVSVHRAHSHEWLRTGPVREMDLFYSDSADVGTEGYQECCLGEVQLAAPMVRTVPEGTIMIDDTYYATRSWHGKGALAVPWLLANGWKVDYSGWQTVLSRKQP